MSEQSNHVPESIAHWQMYSRLRTAPLSFAKPFHMILPTFRLHSMLFHKFRTISDRLFNYFNTSLLISHRNHSGDGLGMSRLSKYGVRTYIHLRACLLRSSDAPPHLYPCDYSRSFLFLLYL